MLGAAFRRRRTGSRPIPILVAAATAAVYFALSACGGGAGGEGVAFGNDSTNCLVHRVAENIFDFSSWLESTLRGGLLKSAFQNALLLGSATQPTK